MRGDRREGQTLNIIAYFCKVGCSKALSAVWQSMQCIWWGSCLWMDARGWRPSEG